MDIQAIKSRVVLSGDVVTLTVAERDALVAAWEALRNLVERLDRDVPRHACPGFDCATCARPNISDAREAVAP